MTSDIEKKLNNLLISLNNKEIENFIQSLEFEIKKLILSKKILSLLHNSNFSLIKLKESLNHIHRESRNLTSDMFKSTKKILEKLKNVLNQELILKNNNLKELIESWKKINEIFNYQNVLKEDIEELFSLIGNINDIENKLREISYLPKIFTVLETEINEFKEKKNKIEKSIGKYFNNFSDQEFVLKLIKGETLSIRDLNLKMYKELYDSPLRDKIIISLRKV
ncbi:MAG: hypothetical protein ACTSRH_06900 [Promethearchaeota archaeon]